MTGPTDPTVPPTAPAAPAATVPAGETGTALDAEDAKLVTLARGARGRAGSGQGAAVRDSDGRTYAAAAVDLPSLQLTAAQAAVALAVSSGATALEAVVVVGNDLGPDAASVAVARDLRAPLLITARADGTVVRVVDL